VPQLASLVHAVVVVPELPLPELPLPELAVGLAVGLLTASWNAPAQQEPERIQH